MKIQFLLIFALFIFIQNLNGFPKKRKVEFLNWNEMDNGNGDRPLAIENLVNSKAEKVGEILKEIRKKIRNEFMGQNWQKDDGNLMNFGEQNEPPEIGEKTFDSSSNAPNIAELNGKIGHLLYQGDMQLSVGQAEYLLQNLNSEFGGNRRIRQAMNATKFPASLWDNRIVPFTFHPSIDEKVRQIILQALDFWAKMTCLEFREHQKLLDGEKTMLKFIRGSGCYSSVGKLEDEKEQEISIGQGCEHFGIIAHEVAHSLGFFHEQSRWDRDEHVRLNAENIIPGFEDQFWKELPEDNDNQQVEYDFGSIMHYTESAFSLPHSGPVLLANEPNNQRTMGQRMAPTHLDILAMNKRYGCHADCQGKEAAECKNGGFPHPRDCSSCICPWGFGGKFCEERPNGCGENIEVGGEWRELKGRIGEEKDEFVVAENFSACHWHLRAPEGKLVELKVMDLGKLCSPGCFFGNTEFKMRANFSKTGIRVCCPSDLPNGELQLKSETNLAVISVYSRKYLQQFRLMYRFI